MIVKASTNYTRRIEGNGYSVTFNRDPACYPYLRETRFYLFVKNGMVPNLKKFETDGDHIVAYELPLREDRLKGYQHYWCRVWKFSSTDPYFESGVPDESVLPSSIVPGKPTTRYQPLWQTIVVERKTKRRRRLPPSTLALFVLAVLLLFAPQKYL